MLAAAPTLAGEAANTSDYSHLLLSNQPFSSTLKSQENSTRKILTGPAPSGPPVALEENNLMRMPDDDSRIRAVVNYCHGLLMYYSNETIILPSRDEVFGLRLESRVTL